MVHPARALGADARLDVLLALALARDERLDARVVRAERGAVGDGDGVLEVQVGGVVDEGTVGAAKKRACFSAMDERQPPRGGLTVR